MKDCGATATAGWFGRFLPIVIILYTVKYATMNVRAKSRRTERPSEARDELKCLGKSEMGDDIHDSPKYNYDFSSPIVSLLLTAL